MTVKKSRAASKIFGMAAIILLSSIWLWRRLGGNGAESELAIIYAWTIHFAALTVCCSLGWKFLNKDYLSGKNVFIAVFLLGCLYMMIITPMSPPDEPYHYTASYELTNHLLFRDGSIRDSADFDFHGLSFHTNKASGYIRIVQEFFSTHPQGKIYSDDTGLYSYPIMYLPQGLGLAAGKLLGMNFIQLFFTGRLFNLIFYSLCVCLAVRYAPGYKYLFFAIGIMPMALHQAASYSYDSFTNGMSLLLTSLIYRSIRCDEKMSKKEYLTLLFVCALQAPAKVGYALIGLLLFLIPKSRFSKGRKYIGCTTVFPMTL